MILFYICNLVESMFNIGNYIMNLLMYVQCVFDAIFYFLFILCMNSKELCLLRVRY